MTQYIDASELLADVRRKRERVDEIARRARAKLGVRTTTRREIRLNAEQRAGAYRAMKGPLGWLFAGSSPEDVVRDSTTLKKIMRIHRDHPRMRHSGRCIIHLPSGKEVKFHPRTGEVTRS
jgi:hypothetical protein